MNTQTQPVTVAGAAIVVVTTGIDVLGLLLALDPVLKVALNAFGGALVIFIALAWAQRRTTSLADPKLAENSRVTVLNKEGNATGDVVVVKSTPPGPAGIPDAVPAEDGADEPPL